MVKKEKSEILNLAKEILMNKKLQIVLTLILFLAILYTSTSLRLSNLPALVDRTTGNYTSNDLDSLYFYRIAETKMANGGTLPDIDVLRAPGYNILWLKEILPDVLIGLYNIEKIFIPAMTFNYSATISGPVIFALILVAFFFLCLFLTKSKTASLISSALLAYSPAFLFRSIAGFYDHDHLGVLAIILVTIGFIFALKRFERSWKETILWGVFIGILTSLVFASWAGAITFVFITIPIASLFYYLLNNEKKERFLTFYFLWIISSIIITPLFGPDIQTIAGRFLDSQGMAALFVLGFVLVDFILIKFKNNLKFIEAKYEKIYSLAITIILGLLGLILIGKNPINLLEKIWASLIYPFFGDFSGRLSSTVAENAQPYLVDLIAQTGYVVFWLFIFGTVLLCINFVRNLKNVKAKFYLSSSMIIILLAIISSRISSTNVLNGENILSQFVYLMGGLLFLAGFSYAYIYEKFKVSSEAIILFSLALAVVINARAAVRSFFLIVPFICLIGGYFISALWEFFKKSKDDTAKYLYLIGIIFSIVFILIALFGNPLNPSNPGFYQVTSSQAQYVGASVNYQWQNAMAWARNSTQPTDIFVHWWDYGYFVQTLANRPTVTDGGHAASQDGNHYIGRYILTTPNPLTAYSFMKTWNVSYLLIDPTEMGKYGAFSKIGSNDSWDRLSTGVVSGEANSQNDKETATGITRLYQLGSCVDQDINFNGTFLPGLAVSKTQSLSCKSAIGGILIEQKNNNGSITFKQPIGAFIYNNKQINLPIKNLYMNGKMITFENGIDAVAYVIPKIVQSSDGKISIDQTGAVIYLSPLVKNSLMGKLYILDDYYGEYKDLQKAYFADDEAVSYIKQMTGNSVGDFIYFQGIRAPLKIWKVNYPLGTQVHKEFLARDFGENFKWGGLDSLFQ